MVNNMRTEIHHAISIIRKNSNPEVRRMMAHIFIDYFKECGVETGGASGQLHAGRFVDECVKGFTLFVDESKESCIKCGLFSETYLRGCPNGCGEK